jgi:hypothetical protein
VIGGGTEMTVMTQRAGLAALPAGQPVSPVTAVTVLHWARSAGWQSPHVDCPAARPGDWGAVRLAAAQLAGGALLLVLDNGQVFSLVAAELTRPSGRPDRPHTLNPAGQPVTHASLAAAPLCEQMADGDQVGGDWPAVTCQDCLLAAPAPCPVLAGPDLDVLAEARIIDILAEADGCPLSTFEVMIRADAEYRAAVLSALERLAAQGAVGRAAGLPGTSPAWRLAPVPAGDW